jgi:ABC-2 type transport system ATP-binding protein
MTPTSTIAPPAIALTNLHKRFHAAGTTVAAVNGLSLTVAPGEIVAFLGPNGAGKTTTLDILLGLTRPDQGTVAVFGRSPAEAVADGRVSAVLQSGGLLADLTVRDTVRMIGALFARTRPVDEVLTSTMRSA